MYGILWDVVGFNYGNHNTVGVSANTNWDIVGTCNILGVNMGKLLPIVITVNWNLKELTSQYVEYHGDGIGKSTNQLL